MNIVIKRMSEIDTKAFAWLNNYFNSTSEKLVKTISRSGDGPLYLVLGLMAWALIPETGYWFFIVTLTAYAMELSVYAVVKNSIRRQRPQEKLTNFKALIKPSDTFSFPSGHTAAGFVFATTTAAFFPSLAIPCLIWASAVGLSRVLLGVHYPGDILAGALLGLTAGKIALSLFDLPFAAV